MAWTLWTAWRAPSIRYAPPEQAQLLSPWLERASRSPYPSCVCGVCCPLLIHPAVSLSFPLGHQVAEILPPDVLAKMHAPDKADYPVIDPHVLSEADGYVFGFPTRYSNITNK